MKIKFLLLGTSLSFIPILSFAQCVETTNCETLGYTENSCNNGKGLKCPFGEKWLCAGDENTVCEENGFKYTCSGTGYSGGSGDSCGGKYTQCNCKSGYKWDKGSCKKSCSSSYKYSCSGTGYAGGAGSACGGKYTQCACASGYEWKNGSCQKEVLNGAQGDLYYCNGAVVGVKTLSMDFYVAMKDLGEMNWHNANSSCQNYSFCGNLKGVLPTKGQLLTMYNNKSSLNSLLLTNGGTKLTEIYYWSSNVYSGGYYGNYYIVSMSDGNVYNYYYNSNGSYVRPVLVDY